MADCWTRAFHGSDGSWMNLLLLGKPGSAVYRVPKVRSECESSCIADLSRHRACNWASCEH